MNHNGQYQNPASPELWSPTRREFLIRASSAAAIAVGGLAGIPLTAGRAYAATQPDWRFCTNCHGLFFSGANCTYHRTTSAARLAVYTAPLAPITSSNMTLQ